MFTSRAEYRLLLREDNADLRLTPRGRTLGLISDPHWEHFERKAGEITTLETAMRETRITPTAAMNEKLESIGTAHLKNACSLADLVRRPEMTPDSLRKAFPQDVPNFGAEVDEEVDIQLKYASYIERQLEQVDRFQKMEDQRLPSDLDYGDIGGLSREVIEKLSTIQPANLGQAKRISGVTPAALGAIMVYLKKRSLTRRAS